MNKINNIVGRVCAMTQIIFIIKLFNVIHAEIIDF